MEIVTDQNTCCVPLLPQAADKIVDRFFSSDVDSYRGLIKKEDARMAYHRPRNEDTLQFATGQFA
jgi:hypothetical protein